MMFVYAVKISCFYSGVVSMIALALYTIFTDFRCGLNLDAMVNELVLLTNQEFSSIGREVKAEESVEIKLERYQKELDEEWLILDALIKESPLASMIALKEKFPNSTIPKGGNLDRLSIKGYTFKKLNGSPVLCKKESASTCVLF